MGASVLINTSDTALADVVTSRLRTSDIRTAVVACQPGLSFMQAARRARPDVAVLDAVEERVDAAQMEIELLKELRQDVRIIAVSRQPSQQDAWVVERGVFFYMAAPAVDELVRVVEAATRPAHSVAGSRART
jgi:DNA-binding response OmpR family regulator